MIIVNYKAAGLVVANLPVLLNELKPFSGSEVVVVDNASPGDDADVLEAAAKEHPNVKLIRAEKNGGFAYGNNRGLEAIGPSDLVFFLNPDAKPQPGALVRLAKTVLEDPKHGVVGPLLINSHGEERASAFARSTVTREFFSACGINSRRFGIDGERIIPVSPGSLVEATWIPGAAMMVRRGVIDQVGGMDEGYFLYFEETDWLEKVGEAGFKVLCDARCVVEHIEGQSTGVVSGKSTAKGLPDYWYDSWYRYWTKNRHRSTAMAAAIAFIMGLVVKLARGRGDGRGPTVKRFGQLCLKPILVGGKR